MICFKYCYTRNDFLLPLSYFALDYNDNNNFIDFYDELVSNNRFRNIIPQPNFSVPAYQQSFPELQNVTNIRMFDSIDETFMFFLNFANFKDKRALDV